MGMASLKNTSADFPSPKGFKVDTLFHQLAVSDEGLKGHIFLRGFQCDQPMVTLHETNIAMKNPPF